MDYAPSDKYFTINENDSVLRQVVIKLPKPPPLHLIDGYGIKDPKKNFFRRKETPIKLQLVEKRARKKAEELAIQNSNNRPNGYHIQKFFWQMVEEEKDSLEQEIKFIKNIWWYLRYGYWFMCYDPHIKQSKPVWISPWHFHYLNFHYLTEAKKFPEYRDVDRRTELAEWYAYTCTETFQSTDKEGKATSLEMKDVKNRLFFGTIRGKRRRGGATAQSLAKGMWIMMHNKNAFCDIIADEGVHAKKIFTDKLVGAWYHMPLWLKPVWNGDERPANTIDLIHPKTVLRETCHESSFSYTEKSTERANDSRQLMYILCDEEGKGAVRADVKSRWGINKETLAQDLLIHGWSSHPSTVEEMKEGGKEFKSMFELSNFYVRKPSGQTLSGLFPIFTKAYDGLDGFIDLWGYSVIDAPTVDQIKYAPLGNIYAGLKKGAKQSLEEELATYLNDGSPDKLKEYRELLRKKPMDSTDCWKGSAGDIGFNILIIDKAIVDAKYENVVAGNFKWAVKDTKVIFEEDKKGKWLVSDLFLGRENKWKWSRTNHQDPATGQYIVARTPANPLITTGGVDPFRSRSASQVKSAAYGENTNLSDGGIAVLLNYDSSVEQDTPIEESTTHKFICTYRHRPTTLDEFCEDALMTFFYYGCMCNGERNTEYMIGYFIKRGYAGYLMYMMDAAGKIAPQPWIYSGGINNAVKADMINLLAQHIEIHGRKECHVPLLEEWKFLSSPEDLHTKDLAAAAGWAIYGYHKGFQAKYVRLNMNNTIDLANTWLAPKAI